MFPLASAFHARGFYAQLAYGLAIAAGPLRKVTAYARYERRHAWFEGFTPLAVDRITAGLRARPVGGADRQGRDAGQPRARRARPTVPEQRPDAVGGVQLADDRDEEVRCVSPLAFTPLASAVAARVAVARRRAGRARGAARAAPTAAGGWLGEELPLPLAVRTPQDLAVKAVAERQYLIFNLLAGGKLAWDAGDFATAAAKWEALLRAAGAAIPRSTA